MIGFIAAFNIYKLGGAIDGLMTDNYKSINAVNAMNNAVDAEEKAMLRYMELDKKDAVDLLYNSNYEFYKYFNIESNNITELKEKELVDKTKEDYLILSKAFFQLQSYEDTGSSEGILYYNKTIIPSVTKVKDDLKAISLLNEKAMFNGKNKAKSNSSKSMYLVIFVSSLAAIIGLVVSTFFANKTLGPVHALAETIKSVKEGDLNKQAPIVYDDEIGMLAREFNNMTNRLHAFEKSTKGTLLEEKNKSVAIVKSISDPLIVLDINYRIMLLNKSCENFFNIDEGRMLNKHILEAVKNGELYEHIFNTITYNENNIEKIIGIIKNDETYYFNTTVTAIRNQDGNIRGIIVLLKNVTELKQLEKIKADFIDTISHEFKTPLTSIMMGIGLMLDKNVGTLSEKQNDIVVAVKEDVQKLTELVSNLLRLSRIQSDKAIFNINPCNMEDIIDNCYKGHIVQAASKKIKLLQVVERNLPEVAADSEKISWVLNNLISNSIKHTKADDEIKIGGYLKNHMIYIYVSDTGEGIASEFVEKIFERFVQVKEYGTESVNIGLGLAIAKEIVEAHGGKIWCESKVNQGSIFTFTLPVIDVESEEDGI